MAELVAVAVETASTREELLDERRRLQALVDVNRELVSSLEMQRLLPLISECVTRVQHRLNPRIKHARCNRRGESAQLLASQKLWTLLLERLLRQGLLDPD